MYWFLGMINGLSLSEPEWDPSLSCIQTSSMLPVPPPSDLPTFQLSLWIILMPSFHCFRVISSLLSLIRKRVLTVDCYQSTILLKQIPQHCVGFPNPRAMGREIWHHTMYPPQQTCVYPYPFTTLIASGPCWTRSISTIYCLLLAGCIRPLLMLLGIVSMLHWTWSVSTTNGCN